MVRHKHPAYVELDRLVLEGKAQLIATPTDITAGAATNINPGVGQVAIITKVVSMAHAVRATTSPAADAGTSHSFIISDSALSTKGRPYWIAFQRIDAVIAPANTPSWHSAVPCAPVVWEPQMPIVIPEGWYVTSAGDGDTTFATGMFAMYGYIVDKEVAQQLGFNTNPTTTATRRHQGCTGGLFTATPTTVLAGRTGQSIQIVDLYIRQQQLYHGGTFTGTVRQSDDDRTIFKFCNNNPSDFAEWKCSPGIYLKSGSGVEIVGDTDIRASIAFTWRFVPDDEVPKNHWWAYGAPTIPSPGGVTSGTLSVTTNDSTALTHYYPADDSTRTTPGTGYQHVVEGYALSVQKDLTVSCDQLSFAITTGTAGGFIGTSAVALTQTNKLISPIILSASHDQCQFLAIDQLNIPCGSGTGRVRVDANVVGPVLTPTTADADTDEWHVLVWGRTEPDYISSTTHFQGAAGNALGL